jgi:predicted nucleic acid-binding protein
MMLLLDSNIIIYSAQPEFEPLRTYLEAHVPRVSAASYVEVLGFPDLSESERAHFTALFAVAPLLSLDLPILECAIALRQARRMKLGDSLIAATALVHDLPLVTHNTRDFAWIEGLTVLDPLG